MSYIVENHNERLLKLIYNYPNDLKKIIRKDDLNAFQTYIKSYNPITKDLIAAYIFYNYMLDGKLFASADVADAVLETLEILNVQESIFLLKIFIHIMKMGWDTYVLMR